VLGVSSAHVFRSWGKRLSVAGKAEDIARAQHASDWKRLSAGTGTKGPLLHDWCYLELADLETEAFNDTNEAYGRAVYWFVATSPMAISLPLPSVQREHRSKRW
jgi:SRSO17 transposase